MGIITRLKLWRSEWRKLREEIIRTAAILQANRRESEERWARIRAYDTKHQQTMAEIEQIQARLDAHHAAEQEKWLAEKPRLAAELERAKQECECAQHALEVAEGERRQLLSALSAINSDRVL